MLSDAELKELLAQKTETRNLDCKTSFSWDTADHDAKCELVKDTLAFLNTQDGGQIVVGVQDDTLEPVGMTEADFTSFDTTKVNDFLHRYTDPQSCCEVQKLTVSGLKFVVINVLEFKDIPIICKKAANSSKDPSKTILKLGGVYIRTEKATSVLVPTSEEMRDLLNRAVLKRSDQLLSTIRTLLKGNPPVEETEIKQYDREIREARKYFREVLPSDLEVHGYWEVLSMPQSYSRERVTSITSVYKSLSESQLSLRGWSLPHLIETRSPTLQTGDNRTQRSGITSKLIVQEEGLLEAQMKQLLGRSQESQDVVTETLRVRSLQYTAAELLQKARENNPGVRSKNASVRQQETQVELAHKNFRPDFNVQYTYQHTASEFRDYYMATFGIRLPNRARQRAELAEAQENQKRAHKELDAESQRVLSEVQQQYVRAKTSEERLKIYSDGLVPQSEAAFQSGLSAYQSNRQDFESLLSGFLDVVNLDLEYRSEFAEHESALAELERLTGVDVP